jgi:hypothetical protein
MMNPLTKSSIISPLDPPQNVQPLAPQIPRLIPTPPGFRVVLRIFRLQNIPASLPVNIKDKLVRLPPQLYGIIDANTKVRLRKAGSDDEYVDAIVSGQCTDAGRVFASPELFETMRVHGGDFVEVSAAANIQLIPQPVTPPPSLACQRPFMKENVFRKYVQPRSITEEEGGDEVLWESGFFEVNTTGIKWIWEDCGIPDAAFDTDNEDKQMYNLAIIRAESLREKLDFFTNKPCYIDFEAPDHLIIRTHDKPEEDVVFKGISKMEYIHVSNLICDFFGNHKLLSKKTQKF